MTAPSSPLHATDHSDLDQARAEVRATYIADENTLVANMLANDPAKPLTNAIRARALGLIQHLREDADPGLMETFLAEYGLSTTEGVALMCLAEALLRVPDTETIDALIADKIAPANWSHHLGRSSSSLVNASTWALMLTGRVIREEDTRWDIADTLRGLVRRAGEPVIRTAVGQAMKVMGQQFVLGRSIEEAMNRGKAMEAKGYTYSYDMLGEAARTDADARRYFTAYSNAIAEIGKYAKHDDIRENPGISVKLSALHARYEYMQRDRVMDELVPRLNALMLQARNAGIGFNIDAEEADRLDLSLDVIEASLSLSDLKGWDGFGVVVQAYSKRAPAVLDWLYALASKLDRKIMVRLVKGAYWDTEIKNAQVLGLDDYPVYTRKAATDLAYQVCAAKLLAYNDRIYPQFATHNANTIATILELAGENASYEFQRLHGMGEALHEAVRAKEGTRCRIYAPVGIHKDLLAYLVRRLLENGANSSFVHQILDTDITPETIAEDPADKLQALPSFAAPDIPLPPMLYGPTRRNAKGWNINDPDQNTDLDQAMAPFRAHHWTYGPLINGEVLVGKGQPVMAPWNRAEQVGTLTTTTPEQIDAAFAAADAASARWAATDVETRAKALEKIADLYEEHAGELIAMGCREAGKTRLDGILEIREAVDFCRFYANEARRIYHDIDRKPRGPIVCISPWNFPLAIFTGQIVAALAAGNPVLAKPAEQSSLIAIRAGLLMQEAGIPGDVLHVLPGEGAKIGPKLTADARLKGLCFTGGTDTAQIIHKSMAQTATPDIPYVAETGGLNAMIVDSTALPEQAIRDMVASAFQSAGQRCSALRVLFVQEDVADTMLTMLKGAMDELAITNPWQDACDVGPVIDDDARQTIMDHCTKLTDKGRLLHQTPVPAGLAEQGTYVPLSLFRLDSLDELKREIFGPVLHVLTFKAEEIGTLVDTINGAGYGLTMGLHTRVEARVNQITEQAKIGNVYVNRNQIGAVVGVQPFGGEGLSGTGPKAGGPFYLARFTTTEEPAGTDRLSTWPTAQTDNEKLANLCKTLRAGQESWDKTGARSPILQNALERLHTDQAHKDHLKAHLQAIISHIPAPTDLPGPTGESNRLSVHGRGVILCLGAGHGDDMVLLQQSLAALAAGNTVLAIPSGQSGLIYRFAEELAHASGRHDLLCVSEAGNMEEALANLDVDGLALQADETLTRKARQILAARDGAILPLMTGQDDLHMMMTERTLTIDTTASGGNASLLASAG